MGHAEDAGDPNIPLLIWLAYEPQVVPQRERILTWLLQHAPGNPLITNEILGRTMHRLAATGKEDDLGACLAFLHRLPDGVGRRRALEGLLAALPDQRVHPPAAWAGVAADLLGAQDQQVQGLARRLALRFGEHEPVRLLVKLVRDASQPADKRVEAIRDLAAAAPAEGRDLLLELFAHDPNLDVRTEACRALAAYDSPDIPSQLLSRWNQLPLTLRTEVVNLLAGRRLWARDLLRAVGAKQVLRTEVTNQTILRIRSFNDHQLNSQIEAVWGKVRGDTPAELEALITRMRQQLDQGPAPFAHGRLVFDTHCAKCHKFAGRGHDVGPNLDGAGRDIEYLLVNILDPNRVVGQPYYARFVALKNGRVETGLLAGEDAQTITLKEENDVLKVIPKSDIETMTEQAKSLMPEGLASTMTAQDFRDLIRYLMINPFLTEVSVTGPLPPGTALPSEDRRSARPAVGPSGRILLPPAKGPAVALISAEVIAPAPTLTRLLLGGAHPIEARLNDDPPLYQGTPGPSPAAPDQAAAELTLRKGLNRLVLQVTYQGDREGIYARLLDPRRLLRYPERKN
jgi:putative heme-binding domain-containing protein